MNNIIKLSLTATVCSLLLIACAPEIGSAKWCEKMEEKPREKWTLEEVGDFAKHCIFSDGEK